MNFLTPVEWRLTGHEMRVFGVLMAREFASKDAIMAGLYGGRDEAEIKIVDVFVCKLRAKLKPLGVQIETRWGHGYFMAAATKDAVRRLLAGVAA